jgi:hypothetical protein
VSLGAAFWFYVSCTLVGLGLIFCVLAPAADCQGVDCPYGRQCLGTFECGPNFCQLECRPSALEPGLGRCG